VNEQAKKLLESLYRGEGYGHYWTPGEDQKLNGQTLWFSSKHIPELPTLDQVYYGVFPGKTKKDQYHRTTNDDIIFISALIGDFDSKDFAGSKENALNHIKQLVPQPSILISSGNGYHAYWILEEPIYLDDDNREEMRDLLSRWVDYVGSDKAAAKLTQLLRPPGTFNTKNGNRKPVETVWFDPGIRFSLYELDSKLEPRKTTLKTFVENYQITTPQHWEDSLQYWTARALDQAQPGNRDDTGLWLAGQLRDAGLTIEQALESNYPEQVPQTTKDRYTRKEYEKSVRSAFNHPRRPPAKSLNKLQKEPEVKSMKIQQAVEVPKPEAQEPDINFLIARDAEENNESGDAGLFASLFSGQVCFDSSLKEWYLWTGDNWKLDKIGIVYSLTQKNLANFYIDAMKTEEANNDKTIYTKFAKRAFALKSRKRADNVLKIASMEPGLALTGEEWDADPWLLGVENGVVDLRTGEHRPGRPTDYIRSYTPHYWKGLDAPAPRWERFLLEVFNNDQSMVDFIQRLLGYGITGSTDEHVLPILYGPEGRNGKSTLLETLGSVLGQDLATSSQADAIMDTNTRGDGPRPFVYALQGKRLVWTSESNEGRRFNGGLIKQLTGGDRLKVRTLHSKPIEFLPSHLLLLITNHKPRASADDNALWDRLILIPFMMRFVDNPQKKNERKAEKNLKEKLEKEAPGILSWLVRGCLEWQKLGLRPPENVLAATSEYRTEEDTLGEFISECCELGEGLTVRGSKLYEAYKSWTNESGEKPMNKNIFGQRMKRRFETVPPKNFVTYGGIGLKHEQS